MHSTGWYGDNPEKGTPVDGHVGSADTGGTDYGFTSDLRYYPQQQVATGALSCSDRTPAIDLGQGLEPATQAA